MAFDWIEGKTLKAEEITEKHCEIVGEILAKIHNIDFSKIEDNENQRITGYQKENSLKALVDAFYAETKAELALVEPEYAFDCQACPAVDKALSLEATARLCNFVYGIPNGVIRMSDSMPGLVETSSNMAIVKLEGNEATVSCLLRSSVDSAKYDLAANMQAVTDLCPGAKAEFTGAYPGWKPNTHSEILEVATESYRRLFGTEAKVKAIHAGLECGLFLDKYPSLDMLSFGPTLQGVHSPDERMLIPSVQRFWDHLVDILKHTPEKK